MLLKEAKPTPQKLRWREPAVVEHDPASLSATLRALAVRAHRHVRVMDETRSRPASDLHAGELFNLERELTELHAEIVQLQRQMRAQNLGDLAKYVSALRQRVEEYLT